MRKTDNYALSRDRAQEYFLGFDQEKLIARWHLRHDDEYLYVAFLGRDYQVCRKSGKVLRWDGNIAQFEETLSIFDFLCHEGEEKKISGVYAPVNSLKGTPPSVGVGTDFYGKTAKRFDSDPQGFCSACKALGAQQVEMGDLAFQFPVFDDMTAVLKFYFSDEDFPATVTLLWDYNTLDYIFYETVFYAAGALLHFILEEMDKTEKKT